MSVKGSSILRTPETETNPLTSVVRNLLTWVTIYSTSTCLVPDDSISSRSYALFTARAILSQIVRGGTIMKVSLHANATTTLKIGKLIQQSDAPAKELAQRSGVAVSTIRTWRKRESVNDRSHTPHRLQTTLTPEQEILVVEIVVVK